MTYIRNLVKNILTDFKTRDPFLIASSLDIEVIDYPLSKNIKGFFVFDNKYTSHKVALNNSLSTIMKRFVLTHELGHAFLHPDISRFYIEKITLFVANKFENEANLFAAELLIDERELYKLLARRETIQWIAYSMEVPKKLIELKLDNERAKNFMV